MQRVDTNTARMAVWLWLCDGEGEGWSVLCVGGSAGKNSETANEERQMANDKRRTTTTNGFGIIYLWRRRRRSVCGFDAAAAANERAAM